MDKLMYQNHVLFPKVWMILPCVKETNIYSWRSEKVTRPYQYLNDLRKFCDYSSCVIEGIIIT